MSGNNKRPRIAKGQLVRSTNEQQNECARTLTVMHYYRPISYVRVRRVVDKTDEPKDLSNDSQQTS